MGVGIATAWLRLASMIGPSVVGLMIGGGLQNVFLAFGLIAAIAALVTALFAIETKGRGLLRGSIPLINTHAYRSENHEDYRRPSLRCGFAAL